MDAVLDASFINAWSIRYPKDDSIGFSDPDAQVGRSGRGFDLGYKLHVSVDHERILPLAGVLAPANENEKRHGPALVERTKRVLRRAGARLRSLVADSQYSSGRMRGLVDEAVIPYAANERRGEDVLRVNGRFRAHGPEEERARYRNRPAVEAAYSFLKTQYGMEVNKVKGLGRVALYALQRSLPRARQRGRGEHREAGEGGLAYVLQHVMRACSQRPDVSPNGEKMLEYDVHPLDGEGKFL